MTADAQPAPEGVGPHEGRELDLMLAGEKPLAMFCDAVGHTDWFPEERFAPAVADGRLVRREITFRPPPPAIPARCLYFARAGEEWRIEALHRIQHALFVEGEPTTAEREREIGWLLGYSEEQIGRYLAWVGRTTNDRN